VAVPRLVIAAPASGSGKTTVSTGLMAALAASGLTVSGHKVGPDYIDPGYHALATGRPGRNLDAWMCGPGLVAPLFLHGARGADIAIVEGVMGLFDGAAGLGELASTAHVAKLLRAPVVLVVDASSQSRSVAALVHGFASWDPGVRVAGVILNKVGSPRHEELLREALDGCGVPVLGVLPRGAEITTPSRHLGLVPVAERHTDAVTAIAALAERVRAGCDLEALVALARSAPPLGEEAWEPGMALREGTAGPGTEARAAGIASAAGSSEAAGPAGAGGIAGAAGVAGTEHAAGAGGIASAAGSVGADRAADAGEIADVAGPTGAGGIASAAGWAGTPGLAGASGAVGAAGITAASRVAPVIAVAGGAAFTFSYAEQAELLRAAGAEVVTVDPLRDETLPEGTAGLVIGGGFPEVYGPELSANASLRAAVAALARAGAPIAAECAGLLYLARELDGHAMCGVLDATARMTGRLTLGYREAVAVTASPLAAPGTRVRGHEFHRTVTEPGAGAEDLGAGAGPAWGVTRPARRVEGFVRGGVHASYLHLHPAARPELAHRFTAHCATWATHRTSAR
jgi:cobyrinic acid a,c-diamide synthase